MEGVRLGLDWLRGLKPYRLKKIAPYLSHEPNIFHYTSVSHFIQCGTNSTLVPCYTITFDRLEGYEKTHQS